ncbi:hypothetical protein [Micromonospora sp. DT47]|uniref:hypothetical protein n=1 Tax=Micromonospora sp. DT47 TaxID=3393431 RepID=UPI003CE90C9C
MKAYVGRVGRPPLPITTPERVARAIVACADRPRREVSVGRLNEGVGFAPNPAGAAVRGSWLPDLPKLARSFGGSAAAVGGSAAAVGGSAAAVGGAVLRRLR